MCPALPIFLPSGLVPVAPALAVTAVAGRTPLCLIQDEIHTRPGSSPTFIKIEAVQKMKKEKQGALGRFEDHPLAGAGRASAWATDPRVPGTSSYSPWVSRMGETIQGEPGPLHTQERLRLTVRFPVKVI